MDASSISVVTAPTIEPITLASIRDHLRIDVSDSDAELSMLIDSARAQVENITGRALITRTLDVKYDQFGGFLTLPRGPLQSVTSIKYLDDDGVEQTLATSVYRVNILSRECSYITRDYGQDWPSVYPVPIPITVRIVTGYGDDVTDVPEPIRLAMMLMIGHFYENREATTPLKTSELPMGIKSLLYDYRIPRF